MADVYGTQTFDDALDKLYTQLVALKDATTADDPKISYVYKTHTTPDLQLNAVTVQMDTAESEQRGWSKDDFVRWEMQFSVRVHTAYSGAERDSQKVARLLNSVSNYLKEKITLTGGWRLFLVSDVQSSVDFEDSATYGGSLMCSVSKEVLYTQT